MCVDNLPGLVKQGDPGYDKPYVTRPYLNRKRSIAQLKRIVNKISLGSCEFGEGKVIQVTGTSEAMNESPSEVKKTTQTCVSKEFTNSQILEQSTTNAWSKELSLSHTNTVGGTIGFEQ